ncbi:MAG: ribbon-helix-helix domain-containing protein [Stellaceae bacterium]
MQRESAHPSAGHAAATELSRSASTLINRNVTVAGRRTSMRLEPAMWDALQQLCRREGKTLNELVTEIDRQRSESSLTAAIRVYLLRYFCAAATDEGHRLAGHGTLQHHFPV